MTHSTHHCVAHSMLFYLVINTLAVVPYLSRKQITSAEAAQALALISGCVGIEVLSQRPTTGGKIGTYCQINLILRPVHLGNTTAAVTPIGFNSFFPSVGSTLLSIAFPLFCSGSFSPYFTVFGKIFVFF